MANYRRYEPELKEKVLRLHLEERRTKKSSTQEYNLGCSTLIYCLKQRREECKTNPVLQKEADSYEEKQTS